MVGKHRRGRRNNRVAISLGLILTAAICTQQHADAQMQHADTTSASASHGKVFGLTMGMPLAQLENEMAFKRDGDMVVGLPPEPSELFDKYSVIATRQSGLCDVIGMTSKIKIDDFGDQIKTKVDEMAKTLEVKYGPPSLKISTNRNASHPDDFRYWGLSFFKGAESYGYVWKSGEKGVKLPHDFETVSIMAFSTAYEEARADVKYAFKNTESCTTDIRTDKAAKL